jgi:hypothetical protein
LHYQNQGNVVNKEAQFNKLLVEAIDSTLSHVLGEQAKRELYIYLKAVLSLDSESIGREPEAFHTGLKLLFGSGAISIETAIVREMFFRIDLKVPAKGNFTDLVKKARTHFTSRKR